MPKHYLHRYWGGELPVDVAAIARAAGIEVVLYDKEMTSFLRYRDGKAIIAVYGKDVKQANYKLAFFLGLYAKTTCKDGATYEEKPGIFTSSTSNPVAMACTALAVRLLLPQRVFNHAIVHEGMTSIKKLSEGFGVSEVAVRERLRELCLI